MLKAERVNRVGERTFEDDAKGAFTDLAADAIMNTDEICCRGGCTSVR